MEATIELFKAKAPQDECSLVLLAAIQGRNPDINVRLLHAQLAQLLHPRVLQCNCAACPPLPTA